MDALSEALLNPDRQPVVIPRAEHSISRRDISPNALKVLYRLHQAGHRACLVGGGVRDLLLGLEPKDFDVGTDAHPVQIKNIFRNCRLIGRRFLLAHVHFGREIIEVATFRTQYDPDDAGADDDAPTVQRNDRGQLVSDNAFGTIEDDACRRDFTINALYYDIADFSVRDYVGGMADLHEGILRLIGDPEDRYREDPVRMLRAIRFMAKLGFRLHPDTEAPIHHLGHLLHQVPPARLFDELLKLLLGGQAVQTFELLRLYGLFRHLLPLTDRCLRQADQDGARALLVRALNNTDRRIQEGRPVTPAFLFACLLWNPVCKRQQQLLETADHAPQEALNLAADEVIEQQVRRVALPRRYSGPMREIWTLQSRFERTSGKRAMSFPEHPRFRAAYDFLLLRAEAGEPVAELAEWWTRLQAENPQVREQAASAATSGKKRRRRRSGGQA